MARLEISILDTISRRGDHERFIGAKVLAVNPTDREGALVSASLQITYRLNGSLIVLQIPPTQESQSVVPADELLTLPRQMTSNGAAIGWLLFRIDRGLLPGPIEGFTISITDSRGPVETVDIWALKDSDG